METGELGVLADPRERKSVMSVLRDTAIVYVREMRPVLREPIGLLFTLTQPLLYLLFFGPLLGGVSMFGEMSSWQWFVPGILVMLGLTGTTAGAGYNMLMEMQTGSHERLLVTPLNRPALLIGRAMKEVVPLLGQAVLVIAVAIPLGFRLYPLGVLLGLLLLGIVGIGLGALSYALAIAVKDQDWIFWTVTQTFMFPLMILSGVLLPLELGPRWMAVVGAYNPLTYIVEAERALFAGELGQPVVWMGLGVAMVIAVIGLALGIRAMRRASG